MAGQARPPYCDERPAAPSGAGSLSALARRASTFAGDPGLSPGPRTSLRTRPRHRRHPGRGARAPLGACAVVTTTPRGRRRSASDGARRGSARTGHGLTGRLRAVENGSTLGLVSGDQHGDRRAAVALQSRCAPAHAEPQPYARDTRPIGRCAVGTRPGRCTAAPSPGGRRPSRPERRPRRASPPSARASRRVARFARGGP